MTLLQDTRAGCFSTPTLATTSSWVLCRPEPAGDVWESSLPGPMWHSHPTGGWIESCLLLWQHVCQGHEGELLLALAPVIQVGPRLGAR